MNDVRAGALGAFPSDLVRAPAPAEISAEVSVVMVVYRTGPVLVDSLNKALADPSVDELIVVDNGSTTGEVAVIDGVARRDHRVTVLRGQGNVGFARGANMGAEAAHGRVVVVLNPDAFLQPGCVPALVAGVDSGPKPCLVGARIMNEDGSEQRGARRGEVTPVTSLLSLTRLSKSVDAFKGFEIHHEGDPSPVGLEPAPTISGACFAIKREDFFALGGFDCGYFLHVEDVDLCWRVRQAGGQVLFEPRAQVIHLGSTSLKSPLKVEFWKGVGLGRYFRKRADTPLRLVLAHVLTPAILAVSVMRPILRGQAFKMRGGLRH